MRWWQLRSYLSHLPRESALAQKLLGADTAWGLSEQLLAMNADQLRIANWQRSGGKGLKPKPTPRPGVATSSDPVRHGRTDRSPEEVRAYLDKFKPHAA